MKLRVLAAIVATLLVMSGNGQADADRERASYRIGPRDVLSIRVYDEDDLNREAVVNPEGSISFPLLGAVAVAGLTPEEAERFLRERLGAKYIVNPQVFVEVKEYNSRRALVLGMVKNPGPYALTGDTTVLDLVSRAGGLVDTAGKNLVLVKEGNRGFQKLVSATSRPPIVIDANQLLRLGDKTLNLVVGDDDIVFVPKADGVYVYGEVKKPGVVAYKEGLTVLQAVSLAEGLTSRAKASKVQVIRGEGGRERKIRVDLEDVVDNKSRDVVLRPEDIVVVPESWL